MSAPQIKHMVDRFLMWRLPERFDPDGGISFKKYGNEGTPHQYEHRPVGTNLLSADQATAMVRHMLEGLPPSAPEAGAEPTPVAEDAELFVPGEFKCAKCGFALSQFTLNANTGAVGSRDHPGEKCPNDGSPLWRVTWKQRALEHYERAFEAIKETIALNAQITSARAAGAAEAEKRIVEWLRDPHNWTPRSNLADAIERGQHK